jgi:predicted phage replisome organizer
VSKVKWIKLTTDIFDDEKIKLIESMPEGDSIINVWIKLLTLAGKINANGYIFICKDIPYTDDMLATVFNKKLSIIKLAIVTLHKFEMIEVDKNNIILIKNFDKHQNIEGLEKIKEQNKIRVQNFRNKHKLLLKQENQNKQVNECNVTGNVTVTECNATDIDIDIEKELYKKKNVFEKFWNLYNKKIGNKEKLFKKFQKLTEKEIELIFKYIPEYIKLTPDKQFRKNPETFLNNKSWNDELIYPDNIQPETVKKPKFDYEQFALGLFDKNKKSLQKKLQFNNTFDEVEEADKIIKRDPEAIIKMKLYPFIWDALIRYIENFKNQNVK